MEIEERLDRLELLVILSSKEALNTREVALMLNLSESRIRHMTSDREIPYYKQGGKVFFKKSEIEKWQLQNRVPTNQEINNKATTYVVCNK